MAGKVAEDSEEEKSTTRAPRAGVFRGHGVQRDGGDAASGERHEFDDGFLVTSILPAIRIIKAKPSSNS